MLAIKYRPSKSGTGVCLNIPKFEVTLSLATAIFVSLCFILSFQKVSISLKKFISDRFLSHKDISIIPIHQISFENFVNYISLPKSSFFRRWIFYCITQCSMLSISTRNSFSIISITRSPASLSEEAET